MKLNVLFGGKAGQGINILGHILAEVLVKQGYYIFQSRDYQSLIRGGHNFNVLTISDKPVSSNESKIDILVSIDSKTLEIHKSKLKENAIILQEEKENMYFAGQLVKLLGIEFNILEEELKNLRNFDENLAYSTEGYNSIEKKFNFQKQQLKLSILDGNKAAAQGALNSGINFYFAYPMTPATGIMNELASKQIENNLVVFQSESEIAAVNSALGVSFTGARAMTGSSGGGFDLMAEALSLQGQTEIPLVVYLASRPGPSTGVPTYTSQADLNAALYSGHGEFPRIVVAPGDPKETIEKTNEAFYLAEKFKTLSIILTDKHLAESEYTLSEQPNPPIQIKTQRALPGKQIVKSSSYEHDENGLTTESPELAIKNAESRIKKQNQIKKEIENLHPIKMHGNQNSKNLIISWGSTKGAILDAIQGIDAKFLQIIYIQPLSEKVKEEMQKSSKIILIENNSTAPLGDWITQNTGMEIKNKILKYDGSPFLSNELNKQIQGALNGK
ncbi:2-oxoacid:acceptor oxidoreductase family protein [Candidatus Pacearchaeota archaeon]|nr:2-oxoacid:acceptor oxidoreductase family protein [Candidatus Pacearchaeota archaeon]